jgi:hypothetical protein
MATTPMELLLLTWTALGIPWKLKHLGISLIN